jgi:hypothetical protein
MRCKRNGWQRLAAQRFSNERVTPDGRLHGHPFRSHFMRRLCRAVAIANDPLFALGERQASRCNGMHALFVVANERTGERTAA